MSDSVDDRITALEAQLAALKAQVGPAAATGEAGPGSDEVVARRSLLRKTGVAIAGVAAGGYVLTQASPAGAGVLDGQPVDIGEVNTGTLATELRTTGTPRVIFLANAADDLFDASDSIIPAALGGWGNGTYFGVYAYGETLPGLFASSGGDDVAPIRVVARTGVPTAGAHAVGELVMLNNGRLSVCSVSGTPGTWSSVGLTPLTPARFLDTRSGVGLLGKQGAGDANVRNLTVAGTTQSGTTVPASARAIAANITVTNPTSGGFLTVWNTGATRPDVSNVNFTPGLTVANFAILPLGTSGQISFFNAFGDTDVLLDISGYFL
jgi:hypothetical protein